MDTPRVADGGRVYLPECAAALGWDPGERVRVWARAGHGTVTAGDGPGKARTLNTQWRLSLPRAARDALRTTVGEKLVALVPPGQDWVLLLSATGAAEAAETLLVPDHLRRLLAGLDGCGLAGAAALGRLADKLSEAELDALAGVSAERLRELGLLDAPAARAEVW